MKILSKPLEETFLWKALEKLMSFILIICGTLLVVVIGISVFMRYVMNSVFFGADEILIILAIWLYWIGGAYGSYEDSHISADMTDIFIKNDKVRQKFRLMVRGVALFISAVLAYWSVRYYAIRIIRAGTITTGLRIPHLASKIALPVGLCLMFLYTLYHFIRALRPQ
jgi:TRAP-type C4-dicarboxylate transport system permease small subunit